MGNIPQLRIKSYSDEWEFKQLGEVGKTFTGLSGKTKEDFGHGEGRFIPYLNVFSNAIIDPSLTEPIEIDLKQNHVQVGDVFFTTSSETPEEVGMSSVLIENCNNTYLNSFCFGYRPIKSIDSKYLAYMLRSKQVRKKITFLAQGISRYNISKNKMMEISIPLPSPKEQQDVGNLFCELDNIIKLQQHKMEKLLLTRKAMLIKMFPQEGKNVPDIRFAGFEKPWEYIEMKHIVTKYDAPVPLPRNGYHRLGIRSHAKGTFHSYVESGREPETAQMYQVAADKFIVNITFGWEHAVAITNKTDAGKLVSHRFPQFSFNEGMVPQYFKYLIIDKKFKHHLWLSSPGGAGRNRVLKIDEMLEYKFWVTSEPEQKKIADFFNNLDNLIALQEAKIEKLKKTKQALLNKMFV